MGTPVLLLNSGAIQGHCSAGAVNLELGWAAFTPCLPSSGVQGLPFQSMQLSGASPSIPSHQTVPSGFKATFVKIVFFMVVSNAFLLVLEEVPGATPKKPASGFTAQSLPSSPTLSQAISSPTVVTLYPFKGGINIAKLVLPHALGKAAAI